MSAPYLDLAGQVFSLLEQSLRPYLMLALQTVHGDAWQAVAQEGMGRKAPKKNEPFWEVGALLAIMWQAWDQAFSSHLPTEAPIWIASLRALRRRVADGDPIDRQDLIKALNDSQHLLLAIGSQETAEIDRIKRLLAEREAPETEARTDAVPDALGEFIMTVPFDGPGADAEAKVWKAVQRAFAKRECIAFWRYPIFSQTGETRKEPDILIVDRAWGLIVIEVKGFKASSVTAINGHIWEMAGDYPAQQPYQQAETQLWALSGYCNRLPELRAKVAGRAIVALPNVTQAEWDEKGYLGLPSNPPIIFGDHLKPDSLLNQIETATPVAKGQALNNDEWRALLAVVSGGSVIRSRSDAPPAPATIRRRRDVIEALEADLVVMDEQQLRIGMQIPPGPQQIRGIAGSGKTVLLCQKAAHMHLKYPDWDIALVFFTRSLYDQAVKMVDKWMRYFTNGDQGYEPNNSKLRVMHTWGAKNRPGLYSTICELWGLRRETYSKDRTFGQVCKNALIAAQGKDLPGLFDAILIDEGQDLVSDIETHPEEQYEDKQPFYWLAYSALRPVDPATPENRRLIWAYDEGQSLNSLTVPRAKDLFGTTFSTWTQGNHSGGIKKSEVMHVCYRTPKPILTAAHAVGMGLLRPGGMISGLTTAEGWRRIGYDVSGQFLSGREITLHRPQATAPNRVPELWSEPVLEFRTYPDRIAELKALVEAVRHNLEHDKLSPHRQLMVIAFDWKVQQQIAKALQAAGIDTYIPKALGPNQPASHQGNPDQFWWEGAVTVTGINRAKGNEAAVVHVVGLDDIAIKEASPQARNQLFTALTRARGWVRLSGIGEYPLYQEIRQVLEADDTFRFTYVPPRRELDDPAEAG